MRIGILTFQYAINYGAVLQMYSLNETLTNEGHDVEIINYIPSSHKINDLRSIVGCSGLKKARSIVEVKTAIKRILLNYRYQKKLYQSFCEFLSKNFKLSKKYNEKEWEKFLDKYDCIIVGSDQVWNPSNQKGRVYFLDSNKGINVKRIAYAVDSTIEEINLEHIDRLRNALKRFSAISVRNEHTRRFVKKICGDKPIVADPVILSDFKKIVDRKEVRDFALVYILGKEIEGGHKKVIAEIRRKYPGIKVIQVVMIKQNQYAIIDDIDKHLMACSPTDWINLIANAKFIYTDSFHGILFALKFHKNFIAYYSEAERAPRLISLQKRYNLGSKIVTSVEEIINKDSISVKLDYNEINKVMDNEKKDAMCFLRNSLR